MEPLKQLIPSDICLKCQVCCRFPAPESEMFPRFMKEEVSEFVPQEETWSEPAPGVFVVSTQPVTPPPAVQKTREATPLPKNPFERSKTIQSALKQAGYYGGNIDGKVGPLTQKAILDFQRANGLKDDGQVGRRTWGVLGTYLPERESP